MHKRTLLIIAGILLAVFLILFGLFQSASLPNRQKNGFDRTWLAGNNYIVHETSFLQPLQQIVGATGSHYFFSVPNPSGVIMMDSSLTRQDTLVYGLPLTKEVFGVNNTYVDSPGIYFFANNKPAFYRGRLNELPVDSIRLGSTPFTRSAWISREKIAIRVLTKDLQQQVFQVIDSRTGQVKAQAGIIDHQLSGGFESDGLLSFDQVTKKLFFVQYLSNQFYCMDTSLNVLYRSHTIDTTNTNPAIIERIKYKDGEKITPASARTTVNQACCTGDGYLYILSALKADNEDFRDFAHNGVIDRYKLEYGTYAGSFHIPSFGEEKIKSIMVREGKLIALYKSHVCVFRLDSLN